MSLYNSSSSSGWWIYGCSLLSCLIIYVYVDILMFILHGNILKRHRINHQVISYWDNKRIKSGLILALALVRNVLSFMANVAPDFLCFLYLLVKQFWAFSKFWAQLESVFMPCYSSPFPPSNLKSVWLVGWEWQDDNADKVIIDDTALT